MNAIEIVPDFVLPDAVFSVMRMAAEGVTPPPRLWLSDWADRHRKLPTKGAAEPGQWRTNRVPFAREIMDCLSPQHPARRVVYMKSTQVAGTEIGNNWIGSVIHTQRVPMMIVQPTIELGERWSKQRLASMISDTDVLRDKIAPARSRDSGNTTLLKEWPGGVLIISGANSSASLRSMPAKYLFCDEVDAYPVDLDGEGDPLSLAEARTSTFQDRKIFLCSTPTIESLSVIHKEYQASDQRHYQVPCPKCGTFQALEWEQLHWPDGKPSKAAYLCAECGHEIHEHNKTAMLAAGRWVPVFPDREVRGYHINALYTPIGLGLSWWELARLWETVRRDPVRLKTFQNTKLGITTADPEEKLDWEELQQRAEDYGKGTIPDGCLALTAGVDVQVDRFAVLVLGHGRENEQWVIDYEEIGADPTRHEDWLLLDEILRKPRVSNRGVPMTLSGTCIDSGYLQDDVIHFTRIREARNVWAVKGSSFRNRSIIGRATKVDFTWQGKIRASGARQWQIGSDTAKERIFRVLQQDRDEAPSNRRMHIPSGLDESFFAMLTAEIYDPNKRKWVKIRQRNEVLDCLVYATAAGMHPRLQLDRRSPTWWDQLAAQLDPENNRIAPQPKPSEQPKEPSRQTPKRKPMLIR